MSTPESINPQAFSRLQKKPSATVEELASGIRQGNRSALARGITLVESSKPEDRTTAAALVDLLLPHTGSSIRLGITGIPGVGKSSFIESFGLFLLAEPEQRVAVLAVDPSSARNGGSILGDKTRMEHLSTHPRAFVRPSPSAGSLGGVAAKTRESMLLCEAAGYTHILVETVGVGQSETSVSGMTDLFILLLIAGAGDELQGIKRGIMEMADLLLVNKADGDNVLKAKKTLAELKQAVHFFPETYSGLPASLQLVSALEKSGLEETWGHIDKHLRHATANGSLAEKRMEQNKLWFGETAKALLLDEFYSSEFVRQLYHQLESEVMQQKRSPVSAAHQLLQAAKS